MAWMPIAHKHAYWYSILQYMLDFAINSTACSQHVRETCKKPANTVAGGYLSDGTRFEPHRAIPMKYIAPRSTGTRHGAAFVLHTDHIG